MSHGLARQTVNAMTTRRLGAQGVRLQRLYARQEELLVSVHNVMACSLLASSLCALGAMVLSLYLAVEEDHNLHLLHSSSTNSQERQD